MTRLLLIQLALLASIVFVSGCNNSAATSEPDQAVVETANPIPNRCTDPRPQMCTQQYDPVCATLQDGSQKTYATGCTACSDANVAGWLPGECR